MYRRSGEHKIVFKETTELLFLNVKDEWWMR